MPMEDTQFKPGQSGNPAGRPVDTFSLVGIIKAKLQETPPEMKGKSKAEQKTYAELLVQSILHKGIVDKDAATHRLIVSHIDGMPIQKHANADGSNLQINLVDFKSSNSNPE